jgi:hypothetical protein
MDEFTELQDVLAAKGSDIEPTARPRNDDEPEEKDAVDHIQWVVLPNGRFAAAGKTAETLPNGAYTLLMTEAGLLFESKKLMTDSLIDLGNSASLKVINGIRLFWTRRPRYTQKGILFKRGILVWGPPGSGKTATIALLIQELILSGGIVLLIQNPSTAVLGLKQLRQIEPNRPLIVVLEDVDEIIRGYGEHDLLALLDGEHQTDNVVNIATTNYPEQLGSRIVNRPSRFDEVVKIGMPSAEMRIQYLRHILADEVDQYDYMKWAQETDGLSIAHLKELVVAVTCLDQNYDEVIRRIKTMKMAPKSSSLGEEPGFKTPTPATIAGLVWGVGQQAKPSR